MEKHESEIGKLQNNSEFFEEKFQLMEKERRRDKESFYHKFGVIEDKLESERIEKKNLVKDLEEKIKSKNAELAEIKADLQKIKNTKNIFENELKSKDNEIAEINMELKRFNNFVEEETSSKIFFNKELEKKSSHLESKMTDIIDLKKNVSLLETTTHKTNDKLSSQSDLQVTTHDNISSDSNYHDSASHSVRKPKQEPELELEKSHSTINDQSNISNPANESQVSTIHSSKVIKVNKVSKGKGITVDQPNIGHYIIENTFCVINNFLKGMFKSGMGWGILIIILIQCTAALQANDSLSLSQMEEMNQTSIPEAFSFLGVGATTTIYGATTMFSKNYIINLGDAEDRLTKDISASCDAISTQDGICKKNPASCPM